jgi:hypothetical protein
MVRIGGLTGFDVHSRCNSKRDTQKRDSTRDPKPENTHPAEKKKVRVANAIMMVIRITSASAMEYCIKKLFEIATCQCDLISCEGKRWPVSARTGGRPRALQNGKHRDWSQLKAMLQYGTWHLFAEHFPRDRLARC